MKIEGEGGEIRDAISRQFFFRFMQSISKREFSDIKFSVTSKKWISILDRLITIV